MWKYVGLEVYTDEAEWPEGTPADWLNRRAVLWCDAEDRRFVGRFSIWRILGWRLLDWGERLHGIAWLAWVHLAAIKCWFVGHDIESWVHGPSMCRRCYMWWPEDTTVLPDYFHSAYVWLVEHCEWFNKADIWLAMNHPEIYRRLPSWWVY